VARRAPRGPPKAERGADAGPAAPQAPLLIISKWAGHYDSAFTQKTYVHASEEDLQRGQAALARIHKIA
jgi:integrase